MLRKLRPGIIDEILESRPATNENKEGNKLSCTFCGKGQEEVRKLIAGPSVYM